MTRRYGLPRAHLLLYFYNMHHFLDLWGLIVSYRRMGRRPAYITQASIARAIRAAKANGAAAVEVQHADGAIIRILVNAPPLAPEKTESLANRDIIL